MKKMLSTIFLFIFCFSLFSQSTNVPEIIEKNDLILSKEVYFDFGESAIRPDADSTLQDILKFCDKRKKISIHLTAHTDAIGSNENNLKLSKNRMAEVTQFLEKNGLQMDSVTTEVFGESNPIADNDSEEGRQQNRRATVEIYQHRKMMTIAGEVRDKETGKGIEADVFIKTKEKRDSIRTDTSGHFESLVPVGAVVGIETYAEGYFLESTMLKALPGKMPDLTYELPPMQIGESVDIKNLYFVGNRAVLLPKSEPELPKILRFMQINRKAKIEIAGHVNLPNRPDCGTSSSHYILSVNRALLVYDYLIKRGIPEERVTYKGYGNWEMRYPKARTEFYQAQNRRVEIKILDIAKD